MLNVLLITSFLAVTSAFDAGVAVSLDFNIFEQAKNVYFSYAIDALNNAKIPDIDFSGGYIKGNSFHITEASKDVEFKPAGDNSVILAVNDLGAHFHSDSFRYKISIIECKGNVDVTISQMSVSVQLKLIDQTLSNGKVVPAVQVVNVDVNLPKDHIDIHIHGNIVAKIADAFKSLFLGTIRDQITGQLKSAIRDQMPPEVNSILAKQKGVSELYSGIDLDWSLPTNPIIDANALQFGIKGLFFAADKGEVEPADQPPKMPYHDSGIKSQFQVFLSNYMFDSGADSFLKTRGLSFWTKSKDVPASFPIKFTTTGLNTFFPGMEDHYGPNLPVDVEYSILKLNNFHSREALSTLSFDADAAVSFIVEKADGTTEHAVDVNLHDFYFNFTALIESMSVTMNVTSCTIASINVTSTTFGPIDLTKVAQLFNTGVALGIPFFNIWIQTQKIIIPSELFGLFKLSDVTVVYHNDYLEAGLTPTFVPPSISEPVPFVVPDTHNQVKFKLGKDEDGSPIVIEYLEDL